MGGAPERNSTDSMSSLVHKIANTKGQKERKRIWEEAKRDTILIALSLCCCPPFIPLRNQNFYSWSQPVFDHHFPCCFLCAHSTFITFIYHVSRTLKEGSCALKLMFCLNGKRFLTGRIGPLLFIDQVVKGKQINSGTAS